MDATSTTPSLEIKIEPAGPCRKKVSVSIPPTRIAEEFEKTYRQWTKSVPIPGFRPGKAPRKLVEKRFGDKVADEVKQSLVESAYEEALKKDELSPIAEPDIDLEKVELKREEPLNLEFTVTVKPEFELPDLKELTVSAPSADPTDDEVNRAVENLRKRKAVLRPSDEPIAEGDVLTLHVKGTSEGEEVFHQEEMLYEVGSHYLGGLVASGLDEEALGKKAGTALKGTAFSPPQEEDHPLAGLEIAVEAQVSDVKRPEPPALDDALAKAFDFESKDELIEAVRRDVANEKSRRRSRVIEDLALHQLVEKTTFELPTDLIEKEISDLSRRAAYDMQMENKSEEEIAQRLAELQKRRREETENELKAYFILDKIVEKERLLVTETEVREAIAVLAAYNDKTPEQMYQMLRDAGRLGSLRSQLRERKARNRLREKVKVTEAAAGGKAEKGPAAQESPSPKGKAAKKKTKKKKD